MTRDDYFRFRTGASGLSDDELMLLDGFFPGWQLNGNYLDTENFSEYMNLDFTHSMTSDALKSLLARWVEIGWLDHEEEKGRYNLSLTLLGGAVWEQERLPVWNRFLQTSEWRLPGDSPLAYLTISSPASNTIRAYLRTATCSGLHEVKALPQGVAAPKMAGDSLEETFDGI